MADQDETLVEETETTETEDTDTKDDKDKSDDSSKYLKLIANKISEDFDDDIPLLSLIKEKKNTCSKEYAINNIDDYKENELSIDLLFNDEYDLNNDCKITEEEIELVEVIFDDYDDKSILDKIIENLNTCSKEYKTQHSNYKDEGLDWPHSIIGTDEFKKDYDLNKDEKITIEDYNLACQIIDLNNRILNRSKGTIISSLSGIQALSDLPKDLSKSLNEISKYLFIKHEAKSSTVSIKPEDIKNQLGKCTQQYFIKNKSGKIYTGKDFDKYDLDKDGIITENDIKLAEEGQAKPEYLETIIDGLQTIASQLKSSTQKNIYEEKDLYIKHVAAEIFAYSDFDRYNVNNLLNRAVQNATLLANKFNW